MNFGERLIELRKERGFTNRNDFANYIGMPSTTLRNYETNVREPGHIFLKQMADIFHVSIDYLLCMTDDRTPPRNQSDFSVIEIEHIKKYRALDEHGKEMVDFTLQKEWERTAVKEHVEDVEKYKRAQRYYDHVLANKKRKTVDDYVAPFPDEDVPPKTLSELADELLNAAHAMENASEADKQFDEDIMNDYTF